MKDYRGIYAIENKITKEKYIGLSIKVRSRWKKHRYELNNNKHHSAKLQNAWNKYGEENFKFYIIRFAFSEVDLSQLEKFYIEKYDTYMNGYNCTPGGEYIDNKTLKKLSDAGEGENTAAAKLTELEVIKILIRRSKNESIKSIHESYSHVARSTISDICNNKNWIYLPRDIEQLEQMLNEKYGESEYLADSDVNVRLIQKDIGLNQGINNARAKLTQEEAIDILIRHLNGESGLEISKHYKKVSIKTIYNICEGTRWKYLPRDLDKLKNMATR